MPVTRYPVSFQLLYFSGMTRFIENDHKQVIVSGYYDWLTF